MIYIFLLLIGVTELRSVHVHMIKLSNKGEMVQFNRERMIVLGLRSILLTYSEQDYMLLFQPSFFTVTPDHF